MEISGDPSLMEQGLAYLIKQGVKELCIHCGACTAICPTGALSIERPSMLVSFHPDNCTACGLCVKACPPRAMEVSF